jgi:general secretion pathway protein D
MVGIPAATSILSRHRLTLVVGPCLCLHALLGHVGPLHAEDLPAPPIGAEADAAAARRLIQQALDAQSARGGQAAPPAMAATPGEAPAGPEAEGLLLARLSAEVAAKQLEAKRTGQRDPAAALALLDATAKGLDGQPIPPASREQFLRRIERTRREIEEVAGKRRAELALEARNAEVEAGMDRERARRVEVDQRIALLVEEYNTLVDQQRFPEAEAVAKKAGELAPDNSVVRQLLAQSRMIRRLHAQKSIEGGRQDGFLDVVEDVAMSATPFAGPIAFPTTRDWQDLTKNRSQLRAEGRARATPAEQEILRRLENKVKPTYRDQPLAAVLDAMAREAGVAIHLDMVGLDQEAVRSDTPVTLSLDQPISLKSALKLLLEPLHLGYAVRDEVLKVTSPRLVKGDVYAVTYPVADLVLAVPNFSSDGLGITGALRDGYAQTGLRNSLAVQVGPPPAGLNVAPGGGASTGAQVGAASLAQFPGAGGAPTTGSVPSIPFGPPASGGAQADFQPLMELIQSTIAPDTWQANGGNGAISPFFTNLSLVVSQTQEVHEQIADLLEQLRRLQDLQVTIEVRFITLNDTFFERIGVDFDFNIQSGVNQPLNLTAVPNQSNGSTSPASLGIAARPGGRSQTIGLDNFGNPGVALNPFSASVGGGGGQGGQGGQGGLGGGGGQGGGQVGQVGGVGQQNVAQGVNGLNSGNRNFFSIPFRQNSFGSAAVPVFPGMPDPVTSAANFGFAILSDIEAFFLIQAAQGNTRSNVMSAPKVTLFNGQTAFVSDTRQRPFVTSVVPVVGDFAAAQQPVITVLNEGTAVNVQAVVSNDRRFVRLTLVPFFSQIGAVEQFQFEGSRSTKSKSSDEKAGSELSVPGAEGLLDIGGFTANQASSGELEMQSNGTTIQLPEFLFTTVTTTVSVPDGGTVLLGGIKRLREGRNEFGVPILSKIPYVNRLFKNVGLGRTTDSLMLMVTPRIIIQEEEEEKLLGSSRP